MSNGTDFANSEERLWWTYHTTKQNADQYAKLTDEVDKLTAIANVLNNRLNTVDQTLVNHNQRLNECDDRDKDNNKMLKEIHTAFIVERKTNLQLQAEQSHTQPYAQTDLAPKKFWDGLGKWTQLMVAVAATAASLGIIYAILHWGIRYINEH